MNYNLPDIKKADVSGKTVFLRADLDVPPAQQSTNNNQQTIIEDDTRLQADLATIQYLLEQGARVIIGGHLDRPKGRDESLGLKPIADWLFRNVSSQKSVVRSQRMGDFEGWEISEKLFLLENLRFYEGEEENNPQFSRKLANLADIYVNDAFAMCHRNHASMVGVARLLPHFAGLHLQKEVEALSLVLKNPKRPLVAIIGGKKIETKLPLVLKMYNLADYVLVGGKIAQEKASLKSACDITTHKCVALSIADLNKDETDITEKDAQKFVEIIEKAKTVVWNGPMGILNGKWQMANGKLTEEDTEMGTREIAEAIVKSGAYSVIGGGDTTEFLKRIGLFNKFNFVSTGGGAMLSFLSGEKLPGLEALAS